VDIIICAGYYISLRNVFFSSAALACPICRYPDSSGGNRVVTLYPSGGGGRREVSLVFVIVALTCV